MKIRLQVDESIYLEKEEIFENVRINPEDETECQVILLGEEDWISHSRGWTSETGSAFIALFDDFSGDIPETFDWIANKYKLVEGNVVAEPIE